MRTRRSLVFITLALAAMVCLGSYAAAISSGQLKARAVGTSSTGQTSTAASPGSGNTMVVCSEQASTDPKGISFCARSWCPVMDVKCTLTAQVGNCCFYEDCVETACQATLCPNQPPKTCC